MGISGIIASSFLFIDREIDSKKIRKDLSSAQVKSLVLQNQLDYACVSKLNYIGLTDSVGSGLIETSFQSEALKLFVNIDNNGRLTWSCIKKVIDTYDKVINSMPQLPFPYYYRGSCKYKLNLVGWENDINKVKDILSITITIPFHHPNHDKFLQMINAGDYLR